MYFITKKAGGHEYLQLVKSEWRDGRPRQRLVHSFGRLDRLIDSGELEELARGLSRKARNFMVLSEVRARVAAQRAAGEVGIEGRSYGPALIFGRLWAECGIDAVLRAEAAGSRRRFDPERLTFLSVLHRLMAPGSDAAAEDWATGQAVPGVDAVALHQLYRTMHWLGEPEPGAATAGRCRKDRIEEALFARRRDLFSQLDLVFFDTTSLYATGKAKPKGKGLQRRGLSKERRPDRPQVVLGMLIDETGRPICSEVWPGNQADVTTLQQVVDRLRTRFPIRHVCLVADAGMVSEKNLAAMEKHDWQYIVGARKRGDKTVRERVLPARGRWQRGPVPASGGPPLRVKEVLVDPKRNRRYIAVRDERQRERDLHLCAAAEERLRAILPGGTKQLLKGKLEQRLTTAAPGGLAVDPDAVARERKLAGLWFVRTNCHRPAAEVVAVYKNLWRVERAFRRMKSELKTHPMFHHDEPGIRGHLFCAFLALVLQAELLERMERRDVRHPWRVIQENLNRLKEDEIEQDGMRLVVRSDCTLAAGAIAQCVGVRLPPKVEQVSDSAPAEAAAT